MSSTTSTSSTPTARPLHHSLPQPADSPKRRIPVTPALLRSIFASSRTPNEERSISRIAFFRLQTKTNGAIVTLKKCVQQASRHVSYFKKSYDFRSYRIALSRYRYIIIVDCLFSIDFNTSKMINTRVSKPFLWVYAPDDDKRIPESSNYNFTIFIFVARASPVLGPWRWVLIWLA
ncbi:uncharacterized protein EV420DRAFT_1635448 [Desarmillaria tabescens]|uniref:Uncharacterized protein n=1 Tax=Armillaria tabescens TaxID=1929756 RepID=A0AA39TRT0_ARMTA|nr:uncharacterized protein EV420DRAFT_1635448 [Desarmillaria tabescens]KAK0468192.1 hypothetical protein EV420DRAFT_1635448 [Desarmillaria tabescens]